MSRRVRPNSALADYGVAPDTTAWIVGHVAKIGVEGSNHFTRSSPYIIG